jgi:hypothetical protein
VWQQNKLKETAFQAHVSIPDIIQDTLMLELEFENKKKYPLTFYLLEKGAPCKHTEFSYRVECDNIKLNLIYTGSQPLTPLPQPIVPAKPGKNNAGKVTSNTLHNFVRVNAGEVVCQNNLPVNGSCVDPLPEEYMNYAKELLDKNDLQDRRFKLIEAVCKNNCFSVAQLSTFLNYLSYELDKLKLVRENYSHLTDPQHKKNLAASFRFESSLHELNEIFKNQTPPAATNDCKSPASAMSVDAFSAKLKSFENDAERMESFKKGVQSLCYSSQQAVQLVQSFTHDREKLEAAKLIYLRCVDKENYSQVADAFSFEQTKKELLAFIH